MIDYTKPTPETDAFMAKIDGCEIDLEQMRAVLHDMEIQRDHARERAEMWKRLALDAATVLNAHAVGLATQQAIGQAETDENTQRQARTRIQSCACSACTGCEPHPLPDSSELLAPDDDQYGVKCDRCGRYVWNDNGNERIRCPTTGEWLCPVCSNVECPYPSQQESGKK